MTKKFDEEDRKQQRLRRLGTQNPRCVVCGESDPAVPDLHHIAGRKHSDDVSVICANHHRKLSDKQRDHWQQPGSEPQSFLVTVGHYLLGLADLLLMIAKSLAEFGRQLLEGARATTAP
jgi:hypothetical protein